MTRITNSIIRKKKRKKYIQLSKGYSSLNKSEQVIQSLAESFKGRKLKKKFFKSLWILRINTICRLNNKTYSTFMGYLKKKHIFLNRKILSFITYYDTAFINCILSQI